MQDDHDDTDTPGWDAINAALAPLYAGQEPRHYGTALPYTLGARIHWMASACTGWTRRCRIGTTSPMASPSCMPESRDAAASGYGFELTFRLAAEAGEEAGSPPPVWPMNLLQNLARYVFGSGNVFEDGHHLNANGPIALETDTRLCHLAFIADPQLPARDTANGHLQFLQLVGLTDEEMEAVKRWSTRGVLQALQPAMPLWVSDLHRGNLLEDPVLAAEGRQRARRLQHRHVVHRDTGLAPGGGDPLVRAGRCERSVAGRKVAYRGGADLPARCQGKGSARSADRANEIEGAEPPGKPMGSEPFARRL